MFADRLENAADALFQEMKRKIAEQSLSPSGGGRSAKAGRYRARRHAADPPALPVQQVPQPVNRLTDWVVTSKYGGRPAWKPRQRRSAIAPTASPKRPTESKMAGDLPMLPT